MRRLCVSLCVAAIFALAGAVNVDASESVTLAWDANSEPDLAGYIVEYGTTSRQYTQSQTVGKVTQLTIGQLQPNTTYYFAVRAYNNEGLTGQWSNEAVYHTAGSAAALSRVSNSLLTFQPPHSTRGTDTAYDPAHDVFLVVLGDAPIYGIFVNATGNPVTSAFTIMDGAGQAGHFAAAKYSPHVSNGAGGQGGFLVTWRHNVGVEQHIFTRIVSFAAPGHRVTGIRQISDSTQGGSFNDRGPTLAYSATSRRFLVAWRTAQSGVRGRFLDTDGNAIGAAMQIEAAGDSGDPNLVWNAATNEFGLASTHATGAFAAFRRIRASDGGMSARDTFGSGELAYGPAVDVNTITNHYVMVWGASRGAVSATFDQHGTRLATNLVSHRLGFLNPLGIAFNENTGTFLAVSSDPQSVEIAAAELTGDGQANSAGEMVTAGATVGAFYPRTAARKGTNQWHVAYSLDLNQTAVQVVSTSRSTDDGTPSGGGSAPAGGGSAPAGCGTADPFVALGGGTCCNGGWLPPGMSCNVPSSAPPASAPPPPPAPTSSAGCATSDPFVAMGGGTCCDGGWLPPGMFCSTAAASAPPPAAAPPAVSAPPTSGGASAGAGCATADPFVALGGGTCCDGGWLPPGMFCSVTTAPPPSAPPAAAPPPASPPPSSGAASAAVGCTTADPFVALGGGTCCNGGWLPPGMFCSVATAPPPSGPPPASPPLASPPPASPPPSSGGGSAGVGCATSDPFVALGGGTCCNGGWLPPGMFCSVAAPAPPPPPAPTAPPPTALAPTPPPPTAITSTGCATSDPFVALGGGICCNGGWLPPGIACSAPAPAPTPPPPTSLCKTPDPYAKSLFIKGVCTGGGFWLPTLR